MTGGQVFSGLSAANGHAIVYASNTINFVAGDKIHMVITDDENEFYPVTQDYTVTSTFNSQVTVTIEKRFTCQFLLKDGSSNPLSNIQVTLTAGGFT